jgi:hypothetical protein
MDVDVGGVFELGELVGDVGAKFVRRCEVVGGEAEGGGELFAQDLVVDAEDRGLDHCVVAHQGFLHLDAIDVFTAPYHHVLQAVQDIDETFCVDAGDVAGAHPTVGEALRCFLRAPPIAAWRDDVMGATAIARELSIDRTGVYRVLKSED